MKTLIMIIALTLPPTMKAGKPAPPNAELSPDKPVLLQPAPNGTWQDPFGMKQPKKNSPKLSQQFLTELLEINREQGRLLKKLADELKTLNDLMVRQHMQLNKLEYDLGQLRLEKMEK